MRPQVGDIWKYNGPSGYEHYLFLHYIKGGEEEEWNALCLDNGFIEPIYWWKGSTFTKVA